MKDGEIERTNVQDDLAPTFSRGIKSDLLARDQPVNGCYNETVRQETHREDGAGIEQTMMHGECVSLHAKYRGFW